MCYDLVQVILEDLSDSQSPVHAEMKVHMYAQWHHIGPLRQGDMVGKGERLINSGAQIG